jgi:ABC-type amino acid transport system permease subunit
MIGKGAINYGGLKRAHTLNKFSPHGKVFGPMTAEQASKRSYMTQMSRAPVSRLATGAAKLGRFVFEHPLLTLGAGAATIGGISALDSGTNYRSPTMSGVKMNTSVNTQAAAANEMTGGMGSIGTGQVAAAGAVANQMQQEFMSSASGLVGGLHRGRHG